MGSDDCVFPAAARVSPTRDSSRRLPCHLDSLPATPPFLGLLISRQNQLPHLCAVMSVELPARVFYSRVSGIALAGTSPRPIPTRGIRSMIAKALRAPGTRTLRPEQSLRNNDCPRGPVNDRKDGYNATAYRWPHAARRVTGDGSGEVRPGQPGEAGSDVNGEAHGKCDAERELEPPRLAKRRDEARS